jgi:hypothetical protein
VLLLVLSGCRYAEVLEKAPYVLTTGLGELRAIATGPGDTVFVAGPKGVLEIAGDGTPTSAVDGDARLVAAQPDRLFAVRGDVLEWTFRGASFPQAGGGSQALPGIVDLLAWCDGELLVAYADHLALWRLGQEVERPFGTPVEGIRAVAVGSPNCASALALTDGALWSVPASGQPIQLAAGLSATRAVARDRLGRAWIVSGDPVTLARVDGSSLVPFASDLGDVRDVVFGHLGLFKPQNVYVAAGEGRIEYVHVADVPAP